MKFKLINTKVLTVVGISLASAFWAGVGGAVTYAYMTYETVDMKRIRECREQNDRYFCDINAMPRHMDLNEVVKDY